MKEEKSQLEVKFNIDKSELNSNLEKLSTRYNSLSEENLKLKEKIEESELKIEKDNIKFKELFKENVNDIKNLQELLQKNEALLQESIQREKKLQHKYCIDIQNAIKLNKKLNEIISKKNNEIAEIKIKQHHLDVNISKEHNKLHKENASLLDNYAKIIEIKEKERRHADEEKRKMSEDTNVKIGRLDDERMKFDYKSKFLEKENKYLLNELLSEIKKKNE